MSYCSWDQSSELNIKYHDSEWGVPLHDDRGQFKFLMMEVMQCGLNWTMIRTAHVIKRLSGSILL
nr:DNA-3-methyladenine glycosylase I [Butyrivibrio sp. AE2032]